MTGTDRQPETTAGPGPVPRPSAVAGRARPASRPRRTRARALVRAAVRMEAGVWRSLLLVLVGRRPGQGPGVEVFPYARDVVPLLWVFFVLSLVELPVVHVLLPWETVRIVLLVVSVWGLLWMLGMLASMRVFPHLQGPDGLRLRHGALVDVAVPWSAVADVRGARGSFASGGSVQVVQESRGAALVLAVMKQTKVDVLLHGPTTVAGPDGPVTVDVLRVHADRPREFVAAARARLAALATADGGAHRDGGAYRVPRRSNDAPRGADVPRGPDDDPRGTDADARGADGGAALDGTPRSGAPAAVEVRGLVRRFGGVTAVDGLDLRIPCGGVYGILGPNGSGKTTTIRVLATLLPPDEGTVSVFGHDVRTDPDAVRRSIALTGQYASLDGDLTARENLVLLGRLLGLRRPGARERAASLLDAFGLAEAGDRRVRTYSGGMRRRLDIAASIVVTPRLLVLDEPTTGLDPRSRNQVWEIVRALVAAGTTVVLTTQHLEEADVLADRVAVLDRGRLIAEGTPAELKARVGRGTLLLRVADAADREQAAAVLAHALTGEIVRDRDPVLLRVRTDDAEAVADALGRLARAGLPVASFSVGRPSLDEVFLTLTGRPPDDDPDRRATDADGPGAAREPVA